MPSRALRIRCLLLICCVLFWLIYTEWLRCASASLSSSVVNSEEYDDDDDDDEFSALVIWVLNDNVCIVKL